MLVQRAASSLHIVVDKLPDRYPLTSAHGRAQAGRAERQEIRQEKRLNQEQLAELPGFSQQYVNGLEQGRHNPTVVSLYELATALGVSHIDLVSVEPEE